uniref:Uncharacterized protein n=1 Tax=Saccharum officinarum TaxID=4547 RepID=A0A678TAK3_SACOF|nr:hypothetical protein SO116P10_000008 [Saccharum officinarum]
MLSAGSWAWACGVSLLACPSQASPNLKWQEWREAGFTEQRSLPASNSGRITGCCTMSPIQAQGLTIANHHFFLALLLLTSLSCFQSTKEAHKDSDVSEGVRPGFLPEVLDTSAIDETHRDHRGGHGEHEEACQGKRACLWAFLPEQTAACLKVASREDKGKMIVTVFPSVGERYMDSDFFADVRGECIAMTF